MGVSSYANNYASGVSQSWRDLLGSSSSTSDMLVGEGQAALSVGAGALKGLNTALNDLLPGDKAAVQADIDKDPVLNYQPSSAAGKGWRNLLGAVTAPLSDAASAIKSGIASVTSPTVANVVGDVATIAGARVGGETALPRTAEAATTIIPSTQTPGFLTAKTAAGSVGAQLENGRLRVVTADIPDAQMRGQGHGVAMYQALADEAQRQGIHLVSDETVETSAAHMYEALQRRGYNVSRNPQARPLEGDAPGWYAPKGQPVFTVAPTTGWRDHLANKVEGALSPTGYPELRPEPWTDYAWRRLQTETLKERVKAGEFDKPTGVHADNLAGLQTRGLGTVQGDRLADLQTGSRAISNSGIPRVTHSIDDGFHRVESENGFTTAQEQNGNLQITDTQTDFEGQGKGEATARQQKLIDYAHNNDIKFVSDNRVSLDAAGVYKKLEGKGYNVVRNPNFVMDGKDMVSTNGKPLFQVPKKGQSASSGPVVRQAPQATSGFYGTRPLDVDISSWFTGK